MTQRIMSKSTGGVRGEQYLKCRVIGGGVAFHFEGRVKRRLVVWGQRRPSLRIYFMVFIGPESPPPPCKPEFWTFH